MAGLTLDASVLVAADRNDRRPWLALTTATRRRRTTPTVPAAVLAQAWRGPRNANLARFLAGCRLEPLTIALARRAGELCAVAGTSDVVDASVVISAAQRGDAVLTADVKDLERLAAEIPNVTVIAL